MRSAARPALRPATVARRAYATAGDSKPTPETEVEPKKKAMSIIDALPGNSIISKTGYITVGAALATALVSKEIYVVNEETLVLVSFVGLTTALLNAVRGPYTEFVKDQYNKMKVMLENARASHKEIIQSQINETAQLRDTVGITKNLFAMSKEMAEMDAQIFELKQKAALSAEIKGVLDSWVRHESALREREQRQIADQVMERVQAALKDPKTQNQILAQAIADVERVVASKKA
ncbi:putative H+-transporting two-sector ATPase chain b precursor, mitochondrial [Syncephalis pseudoplumigaleata]|uniref:ATP synthase subunit 4 n=1 Tax=Syncephalis pseudoplumigaleata TaxID=1712513 RepID=A0A4P9YZN3_9FUNG|nr:putative H+-transporting two-sector ATPase chain b precursor, mitochondrial [Syncephalis pseudoplumigaleata]|eukprot:RKP25458.1 putative H+-transporting two-sector ATPase chain b precursor, mitochondrial [Syncephalis pseudoplumigaleata]